MSKRRKRARRLEDDGHDRPPAPEVRFLAGQRLAGIISTAARMPPRAALVAASGVQRALLTRSRMSAMSCSLTVTPEEADVDKKRGIELDDAGTV